MTHEAASELIALYVLDALDAGSRRELEVHVASCQVCQAEIASLRPASDALLVAIPDREPSPLLRSRVLAAATAARAPRTGERATDTRRSTLPLWLAAAAALLLAAGSIYFAQRLRGVTQELASAREEIAILTAPDVVRVDLQGQPVAPDAAGRVYWSRSRGLVFTASRLPALPAAKIYQLWFVTPGGPVSAGLVQPAASGDSVVTFPTPANMGAPVALAITIEPAGGVPAPTGDRYLIGTVGRTGA